MLPPGLRTPREVILYYDQVYFDLINSGRAYPFLYPWSTIGALIIIVYLLIDHRNRPILKACRWPVFVVFAAHQTWCIFTHRARHPASMFGVGLVSAWGMLWVAAIMIVRDCQTEFQRIERRTESERTKATNEVSASDGHLAAKPSALRHRRLPSGEAIPERRESRRSALYWQSYPSAPFLARVDWVADVFCSFRGVGWNWQSSGIPPAPKAVEAQLRGEQDMPTKTDEPKYTVSQSGIRRYTHRADLVKVVAWSYAISYLPLDAIVTMMHRDPHFWGYIDCPAPNYLPQIIQDSFVLTKSYRLLLSLSGIYIYLWSIFSLGPLFFAGILGPEWIGVRGEAWMNPADSFGSYQTVLEKGLGGWWGGWWHQTFRFAFEAPATRVLDFLGINRRSMIGKAVGLFIAFFLSGCLHASGSYTQLGDTFPLRGPMTFFLLQACGIIGQTLAVEGLKQAGILQRSPKALRQITNFLLVHVWLYYTAPLLVDDFARGGIWLFEPLLFSVLRGLGLGPPDEGFFSWRHGSSGWRNGKHWWNTGIAI